MRVKDIVIPTGLLDSFKRTFTYAPKPAGIYGDIRKNIRWSNPPKNEAANVENATRARIAYQIARYGNTLGTERYRNIVAQKVKEDLELGIFPPEIWDELSIDLIINPDFSISLADTGAYCNMTCTLDAVQPPPALQTPGSANTYCQPDPLQPAYQSDEAAPGLPKPLPGYDAQTVSGEFRALWHAQRTIRWVLSKTIQRADDVVLWLKGNVDFTYTSDGVPVQPMLYHNISPEFHSGSYTDKYRFTPVINGRTRYAAGTPEDLIVISPGVYQLSHQISMPVNDRAYWPSTPGQGFHSQNLPDFELYQQVSVTVSPASTRGRYHFGITSAQCSAIYNLVMYQSRGVPF